MARVAGRSKYGAMPTEGYASKLEAAYARDLELKRLAGEIRAWRPGERLELLPATRILGGRAAALTWRPDFLVVPNDGPSFYVDTKGAETQMWRMKMRVLRWRYPNLRVVVASADGREREV